MGCPQTQPEVLMKPSHVLLGILILLLITAGGVYAAVNGFALDWWTVDGGGGTSEGGDFAVSGTIGQPDAGPLMSGGDYAVTGGFWVGDLTHPNSFPVYFPLLVR